MTPDSISSRIQHQRYLYGTGDIDCVEVLEGCEDARHDIAAAMTAHMSYEYADRWLAVLQDVERLENDIWGINV